MKINPINITSFQSLNMKSINNLKFPEDFNCNTRNNNKYNVSINKNLVSDSYDVEFKKGKNPDPIADQELIIYPEAKYMYIDNMFTEEEARGDGLGTSMHLINIMEMMENNIDRIELRAASSAIPFHIKCGFKPVDYLNSDYMLKNVRAIAKDETPELSQFSQKAKQLLQTYISMDLKKKLTNKLIYDYTLSAIKVKNKKEQEYMFPSCVEMSLTRDDVVKNKDLYNKLFDKYGIDYQISESSY